MNTKTILDIFHIEKNLPHELIHLIQNDRMLRADLVSYFRQNKGREFATFLLDKFIFIRKAPKGEMPFEDLMLACYILGLHNQVEDCLKIWEAKIADFDTYCGLDIQLVSFAGLDETKKYLKEQQSPKAKEAYDYILECSEHGDFDPKLSEYFSTSNLPWYI